MLPGPCAKPHLSALVVWCPQHQLPAPPLSTCVEKALAGPALTWLLPGAGCVLAASHSVPRPAGCCRDPPGVPVAADACDASRANGGRCTCPCPSCPLLAAGGACSARRPAGPPPWPSKPRLPAMSTATVASAVPPPSAAAAAVAAPGTPPGAAAVPGMAPWPKPGDRGCCGCAAAMWVGLAAADGSPYEAGPASPALGADMKPARDAARTRACRGGRIGVRRRGQSGTVVGRSEQGEHAPPPCHRPICTPCKAGDSPPGPSPHTHLREPVRPLERAARRTVPGHSNALQLPQRGASAARGRRFMPPLGRAWAGRIASAAPPSAPTVAGCGQL